MPRLRSSMSLRCYAPAIGIYQTVGHVGNLKIKKIVRETSVTVGPMPSALPPPPQVSEHLLTATWLVSTYLHLQVSSHSLYDFVK